MKKKIILSFIIFILFISFVSAEWWNPLTWLDQKDPDTRPDIVTFNKDCVSYGIFNQWNPNPTFLARGIHPNKTEYNVYDPRTFPNINITRCIKTSTVLKIDDYSFYEEQNNVKCKDTETVVVCDSLLDGNGDGICNAGESCFFLNKKNKSIISTDHLGTKLEETIKKDLDINIIKEISIIK